jgi:serine/threonine protein kinase
MPDKKDKPEPQDTICPSCEGKGGEIGQPCHQQVCSKKGYHYIPRESYEHYRDWIADNMAAEDPEIGRYIHRYLIVEKLGQGGMGSVYLALQTPLMREVALKVVSGLTLDEKSRERFEREAKAISILYHPNIVSLIEYGLNPSTRAPFMAIEYIKGGKGLSDEIQRRREIQKRWTKAELKDIFSQILNGLSVAHKNSLVHRDMKPQNVMLVNFEGNPHFVKILDFGLSTMLEKIPGKPDLTAKGIIVGTPKYMAPEQLTGTGEVDHRVDIYSVGTFLFEMITGKPLYAGIETQEILARKLKDEISPLKYLPKGYLPPETEELLRKALSKDPSRRFSSAVEMKELLEAAMSTPGELPSLSEDTLPYAPTIEFPELKDLKTGESTTYEIVHDFVTLTPATGVSILKDDTRPPEPAARPRTIKGLLIALAIALAAGGLCAAIILMVVLPPLFKKTGNSGAGTENVGSIDAWAGVVLDMSGPEPPPEMPAETPVYGAAEEAVEEEAAAGSGEEEEAAGATEEEMTDMVLSEEEEEAPVYEGSEEEKKHYPWVPSDKKISEVMYSRELWKELKACAGKKKGTLILRVFVSGRTGRVWSAKAYSGKFAGTTAGKCMEKAAKKKIRFHPFNKKQLQITRKYPLK